jgi:FixJ family two-component response regulator
MTARERHPHSGITRAPSGINPPTNAQLIAIVDDDPSVRRALHRLVRSAGYTVQTFASAQEFLERLDSMPGQPPACLVLDIHLNGMSGFDLQARLATDGVSIPVIFISAHDDAPTRERIDRSGAAGHLWKPVDAQVLLGTIRRAIGLDEGPAGRPDDVD